MAFFETFLKGSASLEYDSDQIRIPAQSWDPSGKNYRH